MRLDEQFLFIFMASALPYAVIVRVSGNEKSDRISCQFLTRMMQVELGVEEWLQHVKFDFL